MKCGFASAARHSDDERAQAALLLDLATAEIAHAAGRSDDWATRVDPVPAVLRGVALEVVARVMLNPAGASSSSEQLGAYQFSQSFRGEGTGSVVLTARESRLVSQAVNGFGGSVAVDSIADDVLCELPIRPLGT